MKLGVNGKPFKDISILERFKHLTVKLLTEIHAALRSVREAEMNDIIVFIFSIYYFGYQLLTPMVQSSSAVDPLGLNPMHRAAHADGDQAIQAYCLRARFGNSPRTTPLSISTVIWYSP